VAAAAADWITDLRFYLSGELCAQISQARVDLNTWRQANGEAVDITPGLTRDPELTDDTARVITGYPRPTSSDRSPRDLADRGL